MGTKLLCQNGVILKTLKPLHGHGRRMLRHVVWKKTRIAIFAIIAVQGRLQARAPKLPVTSAALEKNQKQHRDRRAVCPAKRGVLASEAQLRVTVCAHRARTKTRKGKHHVSLAQAASTGKQAKSCIPPKQIAASTAHSASTVAPRASRRKAGVIIALGEELAQHQDWTQAVSARPLRKASIMPARYVHRARTKTRKDRRHVSLAHLESLAIKQARSAC